MKLRLVESKTSLDKEMKHKKIQIQIENGSLRLTVLSKSKLFSGVHRVFLTNILDFETNEGENEFIRKYEEKDSSVIIELISYLKDLNFKFLLDEKVEKIIGTYKDASASIKEAQNIGLSLRKHPPQKVFVPNLIRPLKSYQIPAVMHMTKIENAANFSVPGSGKTTIVLSAFSILKDKKQVDRIVVIGTSFILYALGR